MIKLGPRPPEPPYLSGATVTRTKQQLANKVRAGEKLTSKDIPSYWLDDSVKNPLWEIHSVIGGSPTNGPIIFIHARYVTKPTKEISSPY